MSWSHLCATMKRILHLLLGYKVEILTKCHPWIGPSEVIVRRCWLSDDCTVRAYWHGAYQIVLKPDGTIVGLPEAFNARWRQMKEETFE